MLRKKLKLDTESCNTSPACAVMDEFALSQFANNPKHKLQHKATVPVPCVGPVINMPSMKESYDKEHSGIPYWQQVYRIELDLSAGLRKIVLPSNVAACYDPIDYAKEIHSAYLERFLDGPKPVLFVGMNPGPWGMCQTGVPFGYVPAVRDWMGLRGTVSKPTPELPARPVEGLACTREEQSGKRWWGLFQELCGRNITPSELKGKAKGEIQTISEQYLSTALMVLKPQIIISVGRYTEDRVKSLIKQQKLNPSIVTHCMPHPSPRSLNNTNWNEKAKVWLTDHGIMPYLTA